MDIRRKELLRQLTGSYGGMVLGGEILGGGNYNAYNQFVGQHYNEVKAALLRQGFEAKSADVFHALSVQWKGLSGADKAPYEEMAAQMRMANPRKKTKAKKKSEEKKEAPKKAAPKKAAPKKEAPKKEAPKMGLQMKPKKAQKSEITLSADEVKVIRKICKKLN